MQVIQAARSALPKPPPQVGPRAWRGRLPDQPPSDDVDDPARQRWQLRQAIRQAGIAQVHALAQQGVSRRGIARQLGIHRDTVKKWLALEPPAEIAADVVETWRCRTLPDPATQRREARQAKEDLVHRLAEQNLSYSAIARATGLHRVTVKRWLSLDLRRNPSEVKEQAGEAAADRQSPAEGALLSQEPPVAVPSAEHPQPDKADQSPCSADPPPPPSAWTSWDQVRQVREALREHRFLLLRRPEHLDTDQKAQVSRLVESPLSQIQTARSFLLDWYTLWKDDQGRRRPLEEARSRYETWRSNPAYRAEPALRRVLDQMTDARFEKLSAFLQRPHWEPTNNGAERAGRAFRHRQAPHFNLRSQESIEGALIVAACQRKEVALNVSVQHANRATRGRKPRARAPA